LVMALCLLRKLPQLAARQHPGCLLPAMFCSTSSAGNDPDIVLSRRGCAGVIELNRPKALNALSLPMVRAMHPRLLDWEADPEVAVVLIKPAPGSGKAFCAGGDIRAIADDCVSARSAETGAGSGRAGGSLSRDFFREEYALNHAIGTYKKPYVAFIDGITMGGGVGLSVHGDYRVATERTVFAMPETNIGFFPDVGGGFFLPRLHAQIGVYLALTGHRLSGEDVKKCGIASHFVNSEQLAELEERLCGGEWLTKEDSFGTVSRLSELLQQFEACSSLDMRVPFSLNRHMADIERHFRHDTMPQVVASLSSDPSSWAAAQLETLRKMSPTSLRVTLRQLRLGMHLNLAGVLKMEYRISQRFMTNHDFVEGVRAALVERRQPVWRPASVEEVSDEAVDEYFAPLPPDRELQLDTKRV
ncbi:hypothetical protein BOX15_Mlig003085g2, partial [Macrostomum lignano]